MDYHLLSLSLSEDPGLPNSLLALPDGILFVKGNVSYRHCLVSSVNPWPQSLFESQPTVFR